MSGISTASAAELESLKPETSNKREADRGEDSASAAKKRRESGACDGEAVQNVKKVSNLQSDGTNGKAVVDGGGTAAACSNGGISTEGGVYEIEADAAEDKGCRHTMEDAWVVLADAVMGPPGKLRCAHFAVYDGHGGRLAAEYAQKHLHSNVLSAGLPRELVDVKAAKKAILEGFRKTDESLLQESASGGWQDGATAVCVWILDRKVFIANVGDAKAVVARSSHTDGTQSHPEEGNSLKAIVLTREHKAIYPQERARIQKAGGAVSSNGRLQGRLEVSRAFGDRQFKKVGVISTPDIQSFDITEKERFIILGCDGLWGVFGPSDAVEFVQKLLKVLTREPPEIVISTTFERFAFDVFEVVTSPHN